ncbi:MAG TPA: hypothetical protein EYQ42_08065 [Thiotrichaceae bacterium]|jgi:hypothetical protein|nr:hypothetical protein [Thiotrichaceae bacterium]HIM08245.1 hypothetical protein [Gammaproteobacteria bacterium]
MDTLPGIIDLEASGFGRGNYPIEVGYIMSNGDTFCSLIQPAEGWDRWDESAQAVHGISREILLKVGKPIVEIAQIINDQLSGETIYSDAWGNDSSWLGLLFDEANIPMRFRMDSIRSLLTEDQAAHWHDTKDRVIEAISLKRHRASADAAILQQTFSLILKENKEIV